MTIDWMYQSVESTTQPNVQFYTNKTILITGATGFLGKAVLWKLMYTYGHVLDAIYLFVRPNGSAGNPRGADHRVWADIAFKDMPEDKRKKMIPMACDLSAPDLGLSFDNRNRLKDTQIVIHCAGSPEYGCTLDWSIEINALATLRLMDLADECPAMSAFIHMSNIHLYQDLPPGNIYEQVYDLGLGDPEQVLKKLVTMDEQESNVLLKKILQQYPTTHMFTKALTEHLILRRAELNREEEKQGGKKQWPIAIIRASWLGPSAFEPFPGWTSGLTGVNSWIALHSYGVPLVKASQGDRSADIVPVDYVVRTILGTLPRLDFPGTEFVLPLAQPVVAPPARQSIIKLGRRSLLSTAGSPVALLEMPKPNLKTFPIIYQISATSTMPPMDWYKVYNTFQHYWQRTTGTALLPAGEYFTTNTAWSTAKFLVSYYLGPSLGKLKTNGAGSPGIGERHPSESQWAELATKTRHVIERSLKSEWVHDSTELERLAFKLRDDPSLDLRCFRTLDQLNYLLQACYGIHCSLLSGQKQFVIRTLCLADGWDCALYTTTVRGVIDEKISSVVYTEQEIRQRIQQMIDTVILSLEDVAGYQQKVQLKANWVECLNDRLEDWCGQKETLLESLAKSDNDPWMARRIDTTEIIKVIVLNDHRVGKAVHQIAERSGIKPAKVVDQSLKILSRMMERTQLSYVCFAGSFLKTLFQTMFSSIQIRTEDVEEIKRQIDGKRVVYVPVSKTVLDPLIVWYLTIRYELPVPAIMVDEALAILGPVSDLLRLSGTVFVKRDPSERTNIATAVTAAYSQVLLREHNALLLSLEKVRSRTGLCQQPFEDGLLEMAIDTVLEMNQSSSPIHKTAQSMAIKNDIAFVPINLSYEVIPDISRLISQDLYGPLEPNISCDFKPSSVRLPSEAKAARSLKEGEPVKVERAKGRILVGIGKILKLNEYLDEKDRRDYEPAQVAKEVSGAISQRQQECLVISPLSLVAAILLHSRTEGSVVKLDDVKQSLMWLRSEILSHKFAHLDWKDTEDPETVIFYSIQLLDPHRKIISIETRGDDVYFSISNRADNILQLAYHTNQIRDMFMNQSLFAVACLSFGTHPRSDERCLERYEFISKLMNRHITDDDIKSTYDYISGIYKSRDIIKETRPNSWTLQVTAKNDRIRYGHLTLMASLVYPAVDAIWVTICGLSALEDIGNLPSALLPSLSQCIGAHLISGRRTMYNEVLSTEYSRQALEALVRTGLLERKPAKDVLSPDAQMLLQSLGLSTTDDVYQLSQESLSHSPIPDLVLSPADGSAEQSNIEFTGMKRDPVAALCCRVEQVRIENGTGHSGNDQVYSKCQSQVHRWMSPTQNSFSAKQKAAGVSPAEDKMIQLGYSLTQTIPGYQHWEET
ncbi:male sterility protein-domain-containing protein [Phycomyces blakesleeanus]|uniref:Male sterility protein-domain-containing protein n=1 Tax=Phycomyces blakesleeanus TaxID=4837 RepID=A0ABR3B195_PHYBL